MARDVAQRELDQDGRKIVNLGTPEKTGEATFTDNQSVPKPNSGGGSPGTSFLAAPADHVHPATPGSGETLAALLVDDPTKQSHEGPEDVVWEGVVDFSQLPIERLNPVVSAIVRSSGGGSPKVFLKMGGTPGLPDGETLASMEFATRSEQLISVAGRTFEKPTSPTLFKIVVSTPNDEVFMTIRSKSVLFRS